MISVQEYNHAVKEYTNRIFRFLYKALKDEEAVNDIVQDCYLKLWQNRDKVNPQKIKSWLFSVAHHAMFNYVSANSRKTKLDEGVRTPHVFQQNEFDTKAILERILNELPPLQKSIILLRDLEGYEYKEIGEILQLTEIQVKVYLFRARQKVKNTIKELANVL
jgi:RNA polymerase sigma-70 factor (ECF subfamily)